jgi:hypothetical protein
MANALMKVGGFGCVLWLVGLLLLVIGAVVAATGVWSAVTGGGGGVVQAGLGILIAGAIAFMVSSFMIGLGCIGLWQAYRNPLPIIAGIFWFVYGCISIVVAVVNTGLTWLGLVNTVMIVLACLLFAISLMLLRDRTGHGGLALATGIMFLLTAIFYGLGMVVGLLGAIAALLTIPDMILGAMVFFSAQTGSAPALPSA